MAMAKYLRIFVQGTRYLDQERTEHPEQCEAGPEGVLGKQPPEGKTIGDNVGRVQTDIHCKEDH